MKIGGKTVTKVNEEIIVIPRKVNGISEDIVLRAGAILSYKDFEQLCEVPKPPVIILPNNDKRLKTDDPKYKEAMTDYAEKKLGFMIIKSLENTPDLVWDTVDINDPSTYKNYDKELRDAGFSELEYVRIINGVMSACGMDQSKIDEAMKRFLAIQEKVHADLNSPSTVPFSTQLGEPANG